MYRVVGRRRSPTPYSAMSQVVHHTRRCAASSVLYRQCTRHFHRYIPSRRPLPQVPLTTPGNNARRFSSALVPHQPPRRRVIIRPARRRSTAAAPPPSNLYEEAPVRRKLNRRLPAPSLWAPRPQVPFPQIASASFSELDPSAGGPSPHPQPPTVHYCLCRFVEFFKAALFLVIVAEDYWQFLMQYTQQQRIQSTLTQHMISSSAETLGKCGVKEG